MTLPYPMNTGDTGIAVGARRRLAPTRAKRLKQELIAYAFALPAILLIFTFMIFPLVYSFYLSLTKYNFVYDDHPTLIGLGNYLDLFKDSDNLAALRNTFQFAILFFPTLVVVGLIIAVLIESAPRGKVFFRTSVFLPVIVATSIAGVMFIWIFAEQIGLLNHVLGYMLKLPQLTHAWLTESNPIIGGEIGRLIPVLLNPTIVIGAITSVALWKQIGIAMVIFLGGLQAIPNDLYDAAKVDGANGWQQTLYITIPNLKEAFLLVAIWGIIQAFKVFEIPFVMTKGGPGTASTTLYLYLWNNAFLFFHMGYAAAIGYLIAILILIASWISQRSLRTEMQ